MMTLESRNLTAENLVGSCSLAPWFAIAGPSLIGHASERAKACTLADDSCKGNIDAVPGPPMLIFDPDETRLD